MQKKSVVKTMKKENDIMCGSSVLKNNTEYYFEEALAVLFRKNEVKK